MSDRKRLYGDDYKQLIRIVKWWKGENRFALQVIHDRAAVGPVSCYRRIIGRLPDQPSKTSLRISLKAG